MIVTFKNQNIPAVRAGVFDITRKTYIPPEGIESWTLQTGNYFYISDGQSLQLPRGDYEIYISGGMRYLPEIIKIQQEERQTISVYLQPFEAYDDSLFDADLHIHGPFRDDESVSHITQDNLPVEFLAESMTFPCCVDIDAPPLHISPTQWLQQTTEYRSGTFGHYVFLGGKNHPAHDREHYVVGSDVKLPEILFANVKRAGGMILCAHPITCDDFFDTTSWPGGGYARGLPALLNLGLVDAISLGDVSAKAKPSKELWYHLLNLGRRVPIASGTDVCMRKAENPFPPIGSCRTVVPKTFFPSREISFDDFLAAIRAGVAYVTSGPVMDFSLNDTGSKMQCQSRAGGRLNIRIQSPRPIDTVNIIADGKIVKTLTDIGTTWEHEEDFAAEQIGWLAIECIGKSDWWYPPGLWAHSNPIFLSEKPNLQARKQSELYFQNMAEQLITYLPGRGLSRTDTERICNLTLGKER